jgi:hypothetical protein
MKRTHGAILKNLSNNIVSFDKMSKREKKDNG